MKRLRVCLAVCGWLFAGIASAEIITAFEAAGDLATVTIERNAFRAAIGGGIVAGANGSFGGERREINWDGVPDSRADPFPLPAGFFNVNSPRGVVLSTPGTGFMVSANAGQSSPTEFGFSNLFGTFSAQRLFTAVGSTVTDVHFFVPGTSIAATTDAFGVIFTDVDLAGSTSVQFYDQADQLIFTRDVLVSGGNELFSFLGITVDSALISRVRIISGTAAFVSNGVASAQGDFVVMDDFLYGEPVQAALAVPEPPALWLVGLALLCCVLTRRRRPGSLIDPSSNLLTA